MGRRPDAMRGALDALRREIQHCHENRTARLPSLSALARTYGLSRDTFWRAATRLKAEGLIDARPYHGLTVTRRAAGGGAADDGTRRASQTTAEPGAPLPSGATAPVVPRAEALAARIRRDILERAIAPDQVPLTYTYLCAQYGASYRTMRSAVRRLVESRFLEPYRRAFRPLAPQALSAHGTLVVVVKQDIERVPTPSLLREFFHSIEQVCWRARLAVHPSYCWYEPERFRWPDSERRILERLRKEREIFGFVVWTRALDPRDIAGMLRRLERLGKPIALLDEADTHRRHAPESLPPAVTTFAVGGGVRPGRDMLRYLVRLGHRRIGYVTTETHVGADGWPRQRLESVRRAAAEAGCEWGLTVIPIEVPTNREPTVNAALVRHLNALCKERALAGIDRHRLSEQLRVVGTIVESRQVIDGIAGSLKARLRSRDITALIGENDMVAAGCKHALVSWGIPVPGRMSVVGFDNVPLAFEEDLTSYDFNMPAIVEAMVHHVLTCDTRPRRGRERPVVRIGGHVVPRASSGPAPGRAAAIR